MIYLPAIIGFSILFSLGTADKMSDTVSLIVAAVCFVISIFLFLFKRFRKVPVYSVVLLSITFGILYFTFYSQSIGTKVVPNRVYTLEGEISQFPNEKNGKYYYVLENVKLDNKEVKGSARISSQEKIDANMYDKIKAKCFIYENKNAGYYASKGIYVSGSINDFESVEIIRKNKKSLKYYIEYIRSNIKTALKKYIPDNESAFLCGILTGDKDSLSNSVYTDFKKLGLAHWLAVSGLHLSIFAGVLSFLLKKLNRYLKLTLIVTFLVMFAAITGFPCSVIRSLIMNVLVLLAAPVYRKSDSVNSLGIAVLLICLHSPFAIYDIGFLLSVFSTLGILLLSNRINYYIISKIKMPKKRKIRKIINGVIGTFSCSVSATIFVLPFSIYCFGTMSVIGPLTNLIFTLPFSLLFIMAGIISVLYYIPCFDFLLRGVSFIAAVITRIMLYLVSEISKIPYTNISVYTVYFEIWFVITLFLVALSIIIYKKKFAKIMAIVSVLIFALMVSLNQISLKNSVQVCVVDGGNDLSVIVSDNENTLMIGTDNYFIENSLSAMCIPKVDGAMILDLAYEDFSTALLLCEEFDTKKLYFKYGYVNSHIENDADKYREKEKMFESEKYKAQFLETDSGVYAVLKAGNKKILICSDKVKNSEISGAFDYVITSADNGNIDNFRVDTVIISSYEESAEKNAKRFDDIANKYIATSGKGDIILSIKEDKERIRRGYNG